MKIPFAYYGSKVRLSAWIVGHIPEHRAYVEPFAGSAAVLLAKEPSRFEVINDLDGDVVNFWRVLRNRREELIESLRFTPYSREEYLECRDPEPVGDPVERARRFFVVANASFNGSTSGKVGFSPSNPRQNTSKSSTFARRVDERLSLVSERLRSVEIENLDALAIIRRWNESDAVLYLDPPYMDRTRVTKGDYHTDNGGESFHGELVEAVSGSSAKVILSGYADSLYDQALTAGWRRVDREVYASSSSSGTASRRVESLYLNF